MRDNKRRYFRCFVYFCPLVNFFTSFAETYNAILISSDGVQREHFMDLYMPNKLPIDISKIQPPLVGKPLNQ